MTARGVSEHIRSDNGPEFTARAVRESLGGVGTRTLYTEPGSPWEKGYVENFNGKLRDALLDREVFYPLLEVGVVTEQYRQPTIASDHTVPWATGLQRRRPSCPRILSRCWPE